MDTSPHPDLKDISKKELITELKLLDKQYSLLSSAKANEAAFVGSWSLDLETGENTWSGEICGILGCKLGFSLQEIEAFASQYVHPDDISCFKEFVNGMYGVQKTGKPFSKVFRIRLMDGELRYLHCIADVIRNSEGKAIRVLVVIQDVTENKLIEKALHDSEEEFRFLLETSSAALFFHQGEEYIYVNPASEQLTGYSREELLRMKFWEVLHPENREIIKSWGKARINGQNSPSHYEAKLLGKGGMVRWIDVTTRLMVHNGKPSILITASDITDSKGTEAHLKQKLFEFEALFRALPDIYLRIGIDGTIFDYKEGREAKLFTPQEAFLGKRLKDILPDGVIHKFENAILELQKNSSGALIEFSLPTPIGIEDYEARLTPLMDDQVIVIIRNVTMQKQYDRALKESKCQSELYVDLMAHDINNMNQIAMGYLELSLDMLKLNDNERLMLTKPLEALQATSKLIDNVRKLQREKDGQYAKKHIDVDSMLNTVISECSALPGRDVTIRYVPGGRYMVMANDLLKDVFLNLIGNAIKHNSGALTVTVGVDSVYDDGKKYCRVFVEDDGKGIPDTMKKNMFERLTLSGTKASGKGFGLCLIKMLIDDLDGRFLVEDRVPGDHTMGVRFVVLLPAAK